jgi:peptidoglycan/xylan/chitin deacetylase (PgdA/CDA1 family)
VVLTFDDGYADNLHNAKPLLERYNIPATVFSTTGFTDDRREFWWDELERLLLQPGTLPERLSLNVNGNSYQWELGEAAHYSEDSFQRYCRWRAYADAPPTPRHYLYRVLWKLLNSAAEGEQRKVLDELLRWAGAEPVGRSTHRSLSPEEVTALARGELIEVGAHTVTHPALSTLSVASQQEEIQQSKVRLEEILDHPIASFAYPYGKREHYTTETVDIVREAGFACACSNFAGLVERSTDPFQLPRVVVANWKGEKFARWLSGWLHD